jgi:hypothetical protein
MRELLLRSRRQRLLRRGNQRNHPRSSGTYCKDMASRGHRGIQVPHPVHETRSIHGLSIIVMAPSGQTSAHLPQQKHLSWSITAFNAVFVFERGGFRLFAMVSRSIRRCSACIFSSSFASSSFPWSFFSSLTGVPDRWLTLPSEMSAPPYDVLNTCQDMFFGHGLFLRRLCMPKNACSPVLGICYSIDQQHLLKMIIIIIIWR